jgi:hypothetical protein
MEDAVTHRRRASRIRGERGRPTCVPGHLLEEVFPLTLHATWWTECCLAGEDSSVQQRLLSSLPVPFPAQSITATTQDTLLFALFGTQNRTLGTNGVFGGPTKDPFPVPHK